MENASKALIIAGAILLSILIIALGMRIFNSASSSAEGASLDAQEVSAHNSKFEAYTGKQKGSQVLTLINTIQKNNKEYEDRGITINFSNTTTERRLSGYLKPDGTADTTTNPSWKLTDYAVYALPNGSTDPNAASTRHSVVTETEMSNAYTKVRNLIVSNATYQVKAVYDKSTGLIKLFSICLQP